MVSRLEAGCEGLVRSEKCIVRFKGMEVQRPVFATMRRKRGLY